ncbi:MAG: hypothetical protein ACYDIA_24145 [Candidatus Humimicrobiaceae bacterium]
MLEKAKKVTSQGKYTNIEYARFADDMVILVNSYNKWLLKAAYRRLIQELKKTENKGKQPENKDSRPYPGTDF